MISSMKQIKTLLANNSHSKEKILKIYFFKLIENIARKRERKKFSMHRFISQMAAMKGALY